VKNGGLFLLMSSTAAKEEVTTTRLMRLVELEAAERMERTPFIAGMMSSFSLSFVS
jgi:hypothetical protein